MKTLQIFMHIGIGIGMVIFFLNLYPTTQITSKAFAEVTSTPTPIPKSNTIAGTIYNDINGDGHYTASDTSYTAGSVQIEFWRNGRRIAIASTSSGDYTSGSLPTGTYNVRFTTVPGGYYMTYPLNGPPPSFTVTIGPACSNPTGINDMSCSSGNIINLNFGLNNQKSWIQSYCADIRMDSGFVDPIASSSSGTNYAISNATCNNPGMVFTGNQSSDLNGQKANVNDQIIGGLQYPEIYSPSATGVIKTSYDYMISTAKQSGLTPKDMRTICQGGNLNRKNGSNGCSIFVPPHGLYLADDDVDLNNISLPSGQNYVFLINGQLTLYGTVHVPTTSTLVVSSKRDIIVDPSIGKATCSMQTDIEGLYSTDESFITNADSTSSCLDDKVLTIGGSVVVNAGHTGGTFSNYRNLCGRSSTCASVTFIHRPDMILNAPSFIKHSNSIWQEVAP